jgi:ectoine hydroxylase-related dioxygenase (phytanoyl-CoA dioxygenase family)
MLTGDAVRSTVMSTEASAALDALPSFNDVQLVPLGAVDEFRAKGHTVVRGLATADEVAAYRETIEQTATRMSIETRPLEERDTYGRAFLQTGNLWRESEIARRFVFARRFAAAAAQLLGADGVRLYHDQALVKEAGGGPTPWHQDQFYWPLPGDQTVTLWMPLVDIPDEVGSMTFGSATHVIGPLCELSISDESEVALQRFVDESGVKLETHGALRAGDATFHAGWTLHRAGANPTGAPRPVMTVIYVADGAIVQQPANPFQEFDRVVWLGAREPGEHVDGDLNPLLYRR